MLLELLYQEIATDVISVVDWTDVIWSYGYSARNCTRRLFITAPGASLILPWRTDITYCPTPVRCRFLRANDDIVPATAAPVANTRSSPWSPITNTLSLTSKLSALLALLRACLRVIGGLRYRRTRAIRVGHSLDLWESSIFLGNGHPFSRIRMTSADSGNYDSCNRGEFDLLYHLNFSRILEFDGHFQFLQNPGGRWSKRFLFLFGIFLTILLGCRFSRPWSALHWEMRELTINTFLD